MMAAGLPLLGVDEFMLDLEFVRKLGEIEFNDYAQTQLQQMKQKYPQQKEAIALETARLFYALGKTTDADKIIAAFPSKSEFFPDAVILKAEVAAVRKRYTDADAAYKQYFKLVPKAPAKGKSAKEQFRRAVMIYNRVLKELGKGKEAAAILTKLENMKGIGGDERQMEFLQISAIVDAEANKQEDRKPIDVGALNKALKQLKDLQFIRDGVGASSYIQYARVQIILGRNAANKIMASKKFAALANIKNFKEAIRTINMADSFLEELESTLPRNERSKSPVAEAMFYKAQAIQRQAIATHFSGNKTLGRKQILGAAKYYEAILEDYPDTPLRGQIMVEHNTCAKFAQKMYNEKIELSEGDGSDAIDIKIEQAETLFSTKNYAACVPIYLEAVRAGRRSRKLPNVIMRLAIAYAMLDNLDAAEALVSYVCDVMPKEAGSSDSAYRLGGVLYEKARNEKNPVIQQQLYARAIRTWDTFVSIDPAHQKAPDVAYAIAELQYKNAADLVKMADKEKNSAKKAELEIQALQAFYDAIPKYQRLTEVFSAFDKGVRAFYKLGWIYHTINSNPPEIRNALKGPDGKPAEHQNYATLGADAFQSYFEEEANPDRSDDRLEAKFRSAELTLFGENPLDAVPIFMEIAELYKGKAAERGLRIDTETANRIREDSSAYLPWCFDLAAEKTRQPIILLKERQAQLRRRAKTDTTAQGKLKEEQENLAKQREALAEDEKNIQQITNELSLDFIAMSRAQLKSDFDKLAAMPAGPEKGKQQQELENELAKRAQSLEQQKLDSLKGDSIALTENEPQLELAREEAERTLKAAKNDLDKVKPIAERISKQAEDAQKAATAKRKSIQDVENQTVAAEADKQRIETEVTTLNSKIEEEENQAARDKLQPQLDKAKKELETAILKLEDVYKRKAEQASDADQKEAAALESKAASLALDLKDITEEMTQSDFALKAATLRKQIAERKITIAKRRKVVNDKTSEILAKPAAERTPLIPELRKNGSALGELQAQISKDTTALFKIWESEIARKADSITKDATQTATEIEKLDAQIKPIQTGVDALKQKAAAAFTLFLKSFPKSDKAPDSLARLGTIYIELNQNDKASKVLSRLASEFPNSKANKTARFNLGRAQMDAGTPELAAKTFQEMLATKVALDSLSPANLSFIIDTGLKANVPDITVTAAEKVLSLANNKATADEVPPQIRDKAYVRAAEALIRQKHYKMALKYIDNLLTKNPKTAYYYDAKFFAADARAHSNPPDRDGASKDLEEILQFSTDPAVTNKALCLLGENLAASGDPAKIQQALARFQLVAMLGDTSNADSRPWIEQAYIGYATLLKKEGRSSELQKTVRKYKKDFPNGKNTAALNKLLKN